MLLTQLARMAGAASVMTVDPVDRRRALSATLGAHALPPSDELAEHVRNQVLSEKRAVIGRLVRRAAKRKELPAHADHELASEIASALVFTRLLVTGQPLGDDEIVHIVDAALMPVLCRDSLEGGRGS